MFARILSAVFLSFGAIALSSHPASLAHPRAEEETRSLETAQTIDVPPPVVVPPPPPPTGVNTPQEQYLVYVPTRDPQVLAQVRRINPNADYGIFQGQQIIQAGLFSNRSAAELRSRQLAAEGITSGIAAVVVASEGTSASEGDAAYYVIIPGSTGELDDLTATVRTLVDAGTPVTQRDRPLGPHVAIGPFTRRNTAERLSDRLRDEGLRQTRVYYDP